MWNMDIEIATGDWGAFPKDRLEDVFDSARDWEIALEGIEKPWLCWCADEDWCLAQQKLVTAVGWTPIVGTDGRISHPKMIKNSVFVDFNKRLNLPMMFFYIPLEFQFLFCKKLAFWHSDFLAPVKIMKKVAACFDSIKDGQYMGVRDRLGVVCTLEYLIRGESLPKRWFEVIGCTTSGASKSQYECGCGIWRIKDHPNAAEKVVKMKPHWDNGVGVWFWEKCFGGEAIELPINYAKYHYSSSRRGYRRVKNEYGQNVLFNKHQELNKAFDLKKIIKGLGLPNSV